MEGLRMATDIKAWRETLSSEYELPSGNVARLRRVGLVDLAEQGGIPETLSGQVEAMLKQQQGAARLSIVDLKQFAGAVNLVVKACFVEPRLADVPGEDCLGVTEIPFVDRAEVFRWANESTVKLQPFRR
jgi:hypothetical protein